MKFTLSGTKKLERVIKKNANTQKVKMIVKANGADMQQKAMRYAPVDTGSLKRYIMISLFDSGYTTTVKPLMNYSSYVEYGTRFMEAQPYMKPAFIQQRLIFVKEMSKLVK